MTPLAPTLAACLLLAAARTEAPKDAGKTAVELAKQAGPAIVVITFTGRDGAQQGLGSGFIIAPDGLIATNMHVLGDGRPIEVQTADGKKHPVVSVHASDRGLDLAVLKIEAKNLPALAMGDSDTLRNGQQVLALGHPRGLKHSIVNGIVSGRPDLDGRKMIQVAMPIEVGNSGGPLLDTDGRVQGVITLKSLVTPNLGFAMPVNALKNLLKKPNPIAMTQWVTIGTLSADEWSVHFDGRWRQRGGKVLADGTGRGFGGRTLCLSKQAVPELPFEVEVTVKLQHESGAAGLAFHADGKDRHYGFYPSAGKLRFTRFDGPDVYSWKVLHNEASPNYRPDEWNTIKVRVEKDRILCYVNDHLFVEETDRGLTGGKVGLCKFREPKAEFKNFRVGQKLPSSRPTDELAAKVGRLVKDLPTDAPPAAEVVESLAPDAPAALTVLEQRAKHLEQQAARLRELAQAVHEQKAVNELAAVMTKAGGDVDLVHAALLVARLDNPELDVDAYRRQFDRLAKEIAAAVPKDADEKAKVAALNKEFFEKRGFHGSRADYYSRSNSYLNEVLDDREGLPITLALLYMELARKLGVKVVGVGLPGHFMTRHEPVKGKPYLIDVYDGGKPWTDEEAAKHVLAATGGPLGKDHLAEVSKRDLIVRMLHNLGNISRKAEHSRSLLRYQNAILAIAPDRIEDRLFRAAARYETGDQKGAIADLDWLLENAADRVDRNKVLELRRIITRTQ